jgi:hypothetical protein
MCSFKVCTGVALADAPTETEKNPQKEPPHAHD